MLILNFEKQRKHKCIILEMITKNHLQACYATAMYAPRRDFYLILYKPDNNRFYCPHFIDIKIEAQKDSGTSQAPSWYVVYHDQN